MVGSQVHQHTANTPSDLRYTVKQYTVKQYPVKQHTVKRLDSMERRKKGKEECSVKKR